MTRLSKDYYRADATKLSSEAIQDIKDSRGRIPNAAKIMAAKYRISSSRVYDLWNNCARTQQLQDIPNSKKIMPPVEVNSKGDLIKEDSSKKKKSKSNTSKIIQPVDISSEMTQNMKLEKLRKAALYEDYGIP